MVYLNNLNMSFAVCTEYASPVVILISHPVIASYNVYRLIVLLLLTTWAFSSAVRLTILPVLFCFIVAMMVG